MCLPILLFFDFETVQMLSYGRERPTSLCNHVTLYGLFSPRLLHSLNDHIKSSHSFKHGCNNSRWVILYALVSPQWSHAWFWGRARTILFPATKLCPCVNKLGGLVLSVWLCNSLGRASAYSGHVDYTGCLQCTCVSQSRSIDWPSLGECTEPGNHSHCSDLIDNGILWCTSKNSWIKKVYSFLLYDNCICYNK